MIKEFFRSFFNEFKRDKMIYIVLLIIPIIVNIILGYEFSAGVIDNVPMAIIDYDNSSLSRTIIQEFRNNNTFNVKYILNSSDEMKKILDNSKARIGIIIPQDFYKEVLDLKSPHVLMLYDGSHMSMTSVAKSKASEILLSIKTGISMKVIKAKLGVNEEKAKDIALGINFTERILYNPSKSFLNFLTPGFGTAIVQSGLALMAAASIIRKELSRSRLERFGYLGGKFVFYTILGSISLTASILIQSMFFHVPFRGDYYEAVFLSLIFAASLTSVCLLLSTVISDKIRATIISAVLFVPNTVMIGFTWPVMSMPYGYQKVAPLYPFYHYADNLRDMFLKGSKIAQMSDDINWFLWSIGICLMLNIIILPLINIKDENGEKTNLGVEKNAAV